jgi:hypothetical protein
MIRPPLGVQILYRMEHVSWDHTVGDRVVQGHNKLHIEVIWCKA